MAKSVQKKSGGMSLNKKIIFFILFLFSYGLIAVISVSRDAIGKAVEQIPILNLLLPLPNLLAKEFWYSPTNILYPIIGFFFIFFLIDWINEFSETKIANSPIFPIAYFALSILALYIALFFSFAETTRLSGQEIKFDFWNEWKDSAFHLFTIGGIMGWAVKQIIEKIEI